MSRGKSVAQGAGESARHGLIPRSDTGSALPEDNTRYLGYLSTGGCRFRLLTCNCFNFKNGLTFWTRTPENNSNSSRGFEKAPGFLLSSFFVEGSLRRHRCRKNLCLLFPPSQP